ncbi:hypothetical protein IKF74_01440 [Candidatus Saccharibacteria bacterium]|nr:hypothetical protein [Candidatus Saccharibacteria bacterium]
MSKKIIAGAGVVASLAVALAPLATFATPDAHYSDAHTDELVVTINPSCTFGSIAARGGVDGVSHTAAEGSITTTWNEDGTGATDDDGTGTEYDSTQEEYTGNHSKHIVTGTMEAGTTESDFARTTLKVVCNSSTGYTINAAAANLSNGTVAEDIAASSAALSTTASSYKGTLTVPTGATKVADIVSSSDGAIATKTTVSAEAGDTYEIVYGVGIAKSQKADTYTGDVVYTLYQGI